MATLLLLVCVLTYFVCYHTVQAVRRKLGTVGVSSPLSAVKKAFVGIKDANDISVCNAMQLSAICTAAGL
jgi:hypothetical protein